MAGNREAVCFIADLLDQVQCRMFRRQLYWFAAISENKDFEAGLARFAFSHAEHRQMR